MLGSSTHAHTDCLSNHTWHVSISGQVSHLHLWPGGCSIFIITRQSGPLGHSDTPETIELGRTSSAAGQTLSQGMKGEQACKLPIGQV